jgi:glycosyltransferase involved in cell wall biosynthesis
MRVVIVCDLLSTFLRLRSFLAADIRAAGHEVIVCYGQEDPHDVDRRAELRAMGIEFRLLEMQRTSVNPIADLAYRKRLIAAFETLDAELVFAYQAKAAVWSAIAARRVSRRRRDEGLPPIRVCVLFPGLGYLFSSGGGIKRELIQRLGHALYRHAFSDLSLAIFQNREDRATLRRFRVLRDHVPTAVVNGSGVPLDEFTCSPPPKEPVRFLMATRLLSEKGIREYVAAARQLRAKYPGRVDFVIAGGLDVNPSAIREEEIQGWHREGVIEFIGHQSDVRPLLQRISVFVLPSYYMEGTPRSILEAMAVGRPIVTTNNRGCKETVEPGVNGFLVEKRDVESLRAAMERFVEQPGLIVRMGRESRRLAQEKYDVRVVSREMIEAMGL